MPAAIVSFGQTIYTRRKNTVQLPCLAVGIPQPKHTWTGPDGNPPLADGMTVLKDGSLEVTDIQRHHQGNYTCFVSNSNGSDQIIHTLRVLGKATYCVMPVICAFVFFENVLKLVFFPCIVCSRIHIRDKLNNIVDEKT